MDCINGSDTRRERIVAARFVSEDRRRRGRVRKFIMNVSYRYKQNRCQQLRGFCYAASMGSISKAAKRIGLSQPAVSQQIRTLEEEMAVTLFVRRGANIHLTPDGELLLKMVKPLV